MGVLFIEDISIKVDKNGLYCLADLHKASGGEEKNKPSNWLASAKTKALVAESLKDGKQAFKKTVGRYGGTFVSEQLVTDYAMWINAAFKLKVINAFLDAQKGKQASRELVDNVRIQAGRISILVDDTTKDLSELKQHGANWGSYGASIRKAKKQVVEELKQLQDEIQMKLDFM